MLDNPLNGRRILVVEDDYLLAESLNDLLVEAGVYVLGPVGNVPEALSLVTSGQTIDGALLDVNVRGQPVFPVADALLETRRAVLVLLRLRPLYATAAVCAPVVLHEAVQPAHHHRPAQQPDPACRALLISAVAGHPIVLAQGALFFAQLIEQLHRRLMGGAQGLHGLRSLVA